MVNYYFYVLLIISSISCIGHAYKIETIVGGYEAFQPNHRYQAAIVGKYNKSNILHLLCTGGIIHNYFIITAAGCFIYLNHLKRRRLYVIIGTEILKITKQLPMKEIEKMYTYNYSSITNYNDVGLLKLNESLQIQNRSDLSSLQILFHSNNFVGQTGIVAGYGIDSIIEKEHVIYGGQVRLRLFSTHLLKYAFVKIIRNGRCVHNSLYFNEVTIMCGVIAPDMRYKQRGICMGDVGAPLVLNEQLIGIVSNCRPDCNDTKHGTLYTKVSHLKVFLDAVIEGTPLAAIEVYYNLPHVP